MDLKLYDLKTVSFEATTDEEIIIPRIPPQMVGVIVDAKYSIGDQTDTIVVHIMQKSTRSGAITATLDVVTLSPSNPNYPTCYPRHGQFVAIVDPEHEVVVKASTGTVMGRIIYGYMYGRTVIRE